MPVIKNLRKWAPVKYESEETAKSNEFQYLSTFEELTDYELLEKDENKKTERRAGKVKRKLEKQPGLKGDSSPEVRSKKKRRKMKTEVKSPDVGMELDPSMELDVEMSSNEKEIPSESDMNAWQNLFVPEPIIRALNALGFREPTSIQTLTLPAAIRDRLDILGAAETGSGKTLAFGIPIIAGLLENNSRGEVNTRTGPEALILSPTRELALQIRQHLNAILKYVDDIKIACVIGGLSVQKQERLLKKRPNILIATPGRLWALIKEDFEYVKDLHESVRYLAIDETDRMLEQGHFAELSSILEMLRKDPELNKKRQTFAFSATLTYVHPAPKRLLTGKRVKQMSLKDKINLLVSYAGLRKQHKVIDVTRKLGTAEGLTETRLNCDNLLEKDTYLYYFLNRYPGRTLVFTNSVDCSSRLRSLLTCLRFDPLILHARMHQKQRLKNLERFSDKERSILLATDVAARGLDIRNIDHVIHYQVPRTPETYVHRSGRTARSSQRGLSVMLVDNKDVTYYRRICKNLNRDKDLEVFPLEQKGLRRARELIQLASQLESMEHREKRLQGSQNWFKKAAKEADLEESDDERSSRQQSKEGTSITSKQLKILRSRLNALLNTISITKPMPVTKYPSAYQLAPVDSPGEAKSDGAIDAVNVAKSEAETLRKKYGTPKVKVARKAKRKGTEKGALKRRKAKKGKKG